MQYVINTVEYCDVDMTDDSFNVFSLVFKLQLILHLFEQNRFAAT